MKTILSIFALLMAFSSVTQAESGSASGSCSGNAYRYGYFYAYTYQYAYLYNGIVQSESHSFSFSGFLAGMEKARLAGASAQHVVYSGSRFDLAVPFKSKAGLYVRDRNFPGGPGGSEWTKLCSY